MYDMSLDELRAYKGSSVKAADFDAYWEDALKELDQVDLQVKKTVYKPAGRAWKTVECAWLEFTGVGGARVRAKYLRPRTEGKHPCVLVFHGYTWNSGDWANLLPYVSEGLCVAALDCRGQGGRSEDNASVCGYTLGGHIVRGLDGEPKDLAYRRIYLDTVALARIMASLPEVDPDRMATCGGSQGGALSIACSALYGKMKRTLVGNPFLSDFKRVYEMGKCLNPYRGIGYAEICDYLRRFDPFHECVDEVFTKLSYIDTINLAPRIHNKVLMAIGLQDQTCPPSTQFAVYNNLGGEKQVLIYPDFDHEALPGWGDHQISFLSAL